MFTLIYAGEEECLNILKEKLVAIKSDTIENRFHRLLLDHLISNGFYETALILLETNTPNFHHPSQFAIEITHAQKVNQDILNNNFETALEWCQANAARLKKINSNFEFRLKIHEMLHTFSQQKEENLEIAFLNAIEYCRKNLQNFETTAANSSQNAAQNSGEARSVDPNFETNHQLLNQAMGLLTFKAEDPVYLEKFSQNTLQEIFQQEFSKLLKANKQGLSIFQRICCTGLAAMKTKHCKETDRSNQFHPSSVAHLHGETNCPVCNSCFDGIQKCIPCAQISQSRIKDPITGVNITDLPYLIPSTKHLYGKATIEHILYDEKQKKVACPITNGYCKQEDLKRVYIMG